MSFGRKFKKHLHKLGKKAKKAQKIGRKVAHTTGEIMHEGSQLATKAQEGLKQVEKGAKFLESDPVARRVVGLVPGGSEFVESVREGASKGQEGLSIVREGLDIGRGLAGAVEHGNVGQLKSSIEKGLNFKKEHIDNKNNLVVH